MLHSHTTEIRAGRITLLYISYSNNLEDEEIYLILGLNYHFYADSEIPVTSLKYNIKIKIDPSCTKGDKILWPLI